MSDAFSPTEIAINALRLGEAVEKDLKKLSPNTLNRLRKALKVLSNPPMEHMIVDDMNGIFSIRYKRLSPNQAERMLELRNMVRANRNQQPINSTTRSIYNEILSQITLISEDK